MQGLEQQQKESIPEEIEEILSNFNDSSAIALIFSTLWCIWKARNDLLFNSKAWSTFQVIQNAKALVSAQQEEHRSDSIAATSDISLVPRATLFSSYDRTRIEKGSNFYVDAAWRGQRDVPTIFFADQSSKAGLGVFLCLPNQANQKAILFAAQAQVSSALEAEAKAMELATYISNKMQLQEANFFTDNQVLADAVKRQDSLHNPGNWKIRPSLSAIIKNTQDSRAQVYKIKRKNNKMSHNQAQYVYNLFDVGQVFVVCSGFSHSRDSCPVKAQINDLNVQSCTLLSATCLL